jgi:hypothetical protein
MLINFQLFPVSDIFEIKNNQLLSSVHIHANELLNGIQD